MTAHRCRTGQHGEPFYTCYANHGCRCPGCRRAEHAYRAKHRTARRLAGLDPTGNRDASAVRALLMWLRDQGATWLWVAAMSGVPRTTLWQIRSGRERVHAPTFAAVERLARRVASGEAVPPGYQEAQQRRVARDRMRRYRDGVRAAQAAADECGATL